MKERGKGMGQEVRALVDAEADLADAVGDLRAALRTPAWTGDPTKAVIVASGRVVEAHDRLTEVAAAWERVAKGDVVKGDASRAEWKRQAENLADMYGHPDSVRVWEFGHAPLAFQACSTHAGDEDWVALLKKPSANSIMMDELPRYLRDGANSVEVVHLGDWALVIGAHA